MSRHDGRSGTPTPAIKERSPSPRRSLNAKEHIYSLSPMSGKFCPADSKTELRKLARSFFEGGWLAKLAEALADQPGESKLREGGAGTSAARADTRRPGPSSTINKA